MTRENCDDLGLLIQADLDGELSPAEAARIGAHVAGCARCAQTQQSLRALSARFRDGVATYPASAALRARVAATTRPKAPNGWRPRRNAVLPFGAGFALAAGLALLLVTPRPDTLPGDVVAGHIRALQPGHLVDVPSTDQHTVKPWFDGRLDFAPPVKDFAAEGYPLAGGRLDYLAGRPVAALVYRRRQHVIDVFAWPDAGQRSATASRDGYNVAMWHQGGMVLAAVSDLAAPELADFARLWQAGGP